MPVITIDQQLADYFNRNFDLGGSWNWGNFLLCFIAIILSVFLCGAVGLEREKRGRSAGLRTHLLVGVGSCIVMIISIYGFPQVMSRDVARLAAQVVTGVGFLGAGAIIYSQGGIKGLTTASTIWLVMAIGLACGSMNFLLAIACTIVVMIVLIVFRKFERRLSRSNPMFIVLAEEKCPIMFDVVSIAKDFKYNINDINSTIVKNGNLSCVELTFKVMGDNGAEIDIDSFVKKLQENKGIRDVQVLNHH